MTALALARTTRRRHGGARWNPGAKNSAMKRNLSDFIETAEEEQDVAPASSGVRD